MNEPGAEASAGAESGQVGSAEYVGTPVGAEVCTGEPVRGGEQVCR